MTRRMIMPVTRNRGPAAIIIGPNPPNLSAASRVRSLSLRLVTFARPGPPEALSRRTPVPGRLPVRLRYSDDAVPVQIMNWPIQTQLVTPTVGLKAAGPRSATARPRRDSDLERTGTIAPPPAPRRGRLAQSR